MNEIRKVIPILFAHYAVCLIGCLVWSFVGPFRIDLLAPYLSAYKFRAAVLLFIRFLPAFQVSGLLIGYSLAFSGSAGEFVPRWSDVLLGVLKRAFILILVCVALYVVLAEGLGTVFAARQENAADRTLEYRRCMSAAKAQSDMELYADAEVQLRAALAIWPKSPEATERLGQLKYKLADAAGQEAPKQPSDTAAQEAPDTPKLTVLEALDRATEAEKKLDYFNAHYYATLAIKLAPDTDPNKEVAKRLAAKAWNQISSGTDALKAGDDARLYAIKKSGYDAIQSGDYLRAYYIFLSLQDADQKKDSTRVDPDVAYFLDIAKKGVLGASFFLDETDNLRAFEAARDVFFVIRHPDGSAGAVYIRGVTWSKMGGTDMAYLRDFEYAAIGSNNSLEYQISVPYAKMLSTTSDGSAYPKPEILLHSVDRAKEGHDIWPALVAGNMPDSGWSLLVLDMDYRDFSMIVGANNGPAAMSLLDLCLFSSRAQTYGFSPAVYQREMLRRLGDPFLLLILSVFVLIFGWKFRLDRESPFKAWWILSVPLFPAISMFCVEILRYLAGLCVHVCVALFPSIAPVVVLAGFAVCFFVVSFCFLAQRSD
jgi:hypothetical protein